jgi:class 3 adenylate cyclase
VYLRPLVGQTSAVSEHSERKLATVLFADLAGSTALADDQDPERTRARLERFYDAMAEEIQAAGGTVEKFVGDAVMAAFGAPEALEDHAERALHAALSMQRRLESMFGSELALRIGVNTGEVVVGRARADSSFVSGDAVNVAARLEEAAVPGEILAGERTVSAARGAFEFGQPRTAEAKGKAKGVACRTVVRALSLMRTRGVGGLARAFVGRDAELERLYRAYRRAVEESHPVLVSVLGDAGVGKTRLMRELWERLSDERPEPLRRVGRCLAYGQAITYWPLAEVLKEHFSILENDSPDQVRRRLGERELLGLTLGLDVAGDLHPLAARDRLHAEWVSFLSELTAEGPLVVLIEDVHWGERPLLDLIERVARDVRGPLLVLVTSRPDLVAERTPWGGRVDSETIWLEPLPDDAATSLVESLLAGGIPSEVRELIVEHAEGNPFFVEELLATLIDRGVLKRQNGGWTCAELHGGFEVPDTVQAVLAARIDLLPAAEKAALQAAAVIGRVFWTGPIYELVGGAPDFSLLAERNFVRRRAGSSLSGEREYAIKHALTREVAYASLPKARRAQLHAAFARWLERSGEGNDEHAPLLAHHYAEAVRREDVDLAWAGREDEAAVLRALALAWAKRAAELAIGRYEIDEGLALLHRAVELEDDPAEQGRIWYEIGHAAALKYDGEGFVAAMEKAIELGGPAPEVYAELGYQFVLRAGMWLKRPDTTVIDSWVDKALELTDDGSKARAKALVARAEWPRSDELLATQALELAERLGDVELRYRALHALMFAAWDVADYGRALSVIEQMYALLPEIQDPDARANVDFGSAWILIGACRFDRARQSVERADEISAGLTPHHRLHVVGNRVRLESLLGCWSDVQELIPQTEDAVEANLVTPCPLNVESLLFSAVAAALDGDDREATRLERKAEGIGMEGYGTYFDPPRLMLALARADLETLRRLVDGLDEEQLEPWAYLSRAPLFDALVALGERERVEADAPTWIEQNSYASPFALRALALVREDDKLVEQAAQAFDAIGLAWHAQRTREHRTIS